MTLYHCAPIPLEAGSVIKPGNWGRLINTYEHQQFGNNSGIAFRELAFEHVRVQEFPQKPSRLTSCFALDGLEPATTYWSNSSPLGILYEVDLVDKNSKIHEGKLSLLDGLNGNEAYFRAWQQRGMRYWSGAGDGDSELVIEGSLRVVSFVASR
ncbi:MAG: hypothetical protein COA62_06680 [Rhodobiaceae bacterium]|nr:MAG: hypothetical protein COA62_06680 [Rhodobiaceae bacterium]